METSTRCYRIHRAKKVLRKKKNLATIRMMWVEKGNEKRAWCFAIEILHKHRFEEVFPTQTSNIILYSRFFFTPLPLTILHFIPETYLHNDRMNEFHSTTMEYVEKYFYIDYIKEV